MGSTVALAPPPTASSGSSFPTENVSLSSTPGNAAYDPSNGFLYVTDENSASVTVLNGTHYVTNLTVGSGPYGAVFDPSNGWVYVCNTLSGNVSVLNGTRVVGSVTVGTTPEFPAYDPEDQEIYVPDLSSNGVSIVKGETLVATVGTGTDPWQAIYDNWTGWVDVTNYAGAVTILNGTSIVDQVVAGSNPWWQVFDPSNGLDYVSSQTNDAVYALNGTHIDATFSFPSMPGNGALDPATGFVEFALDGNSISTSGIAVFNGTHWVANLSAGVGTIWITCDPANGETFAVNSQSNNVTVYSGRTVVGSAAVGSYPQQAIFDPTSGDVVVLEGVDADVTFLLLTYPVTFTEHGLPAGTSWWLNLSGGLSYEVNRSGFGFQSPFVDLSYTVSCAVPTLGAPPGMLRVRGAEAINVTFQRIVFDVTFAESGLPRGFVWTVNLSGSSVSTFGTSILFSERNGSYPFTIGPISGWTATPSSGTVSVAGIALTKSIAFAALPPPQYPVTFAESGLPNGTSWTIGLSTGGQVTSSGPTAALDVVNGSYSYSVMSGNASFSAPGGRILVDGHSVQEAVAFSLVTFPVDLMESGLPVGTNWSVTVGGSTNSSETTTIGLYEPNGTYLYRLSGVPGWSAASFIGAFTVQGGPVPVAVSWARVTYTIVLAESGLPKGSSWAATVDGIHQNGVGALAFGGLPNGSYEFEVAPVAGMSISPSNGSFSVSGGPVTLAIRFASAPSAGPPLVIGVPEPDLIGVAVLAAGAIALAGVLRARSRRIRRSSASDDLSQDV